LGLVVDIGVSKLIADGLVKIKQGVELTRYTPTGVIFTDGTTLDADVVIFAYELDYTHLKPLR